MNGKIQGDELDIAAAEFINTFNHFKKAAKKTNGNYGQHKRKELSRIKRSSRGDPADT